MPARPRPSRPARESQHETSALMMPSDENARGHVFGGTILAMMDKAAAVSAMRHARSPCVTAAVDHVDFRTPIRVGDLIVLKSSVNRAFRTSMEVGVKVFAENVLTGERKHTSSAYVTFVAIDAQGQPRPVRPAICETPAERRRFEEAGIRRKWRLTHRYKKLTPEEVRL